METSPLGSEAGAHRVRRKSKRGLKKRRVPRLGRGRIPLPPGDADRQEYRDWLLRVSKALVSAQREIRILRALHWPDSVAERFFDRGARELPDPPLVPLGFDPGKKVRRLLQIEARLDPADPLQEILRETALQYADVVRMLEHRGTKVFHETSAKLYGHPLEAFVGQSVTNLDLARHFDRILDPRYCRDLTPPPAYDIPAEQAARILQRRFHRAFPGAEVKVEVSPDLTADAAAGADRVRVKRGRLFGKETLDYLEQHEGYVHIATTLNGREQPFLPILGKASPRATRVNEGLAVFGEWASHTLTVARVRRLVDRVLAIRMAEEGADFLQVYRAFLERGEARATAFDIARRVFRGGDIRGGAPFTKDASYLGDFLRIFNFVRLAVKRHCLALLDLLFVGKVTVSDLPVLADRLRSGEIVPPRYLPPWAADKNWLASHMALSSFLNLIELSKTEPFYEDLFRRCGAVGAVSPWLPDAPPGNRIPLDGPVAPPEPSPG